jgi:hypothetical protein
VCIASGFVSHTVALGQDAARMFFLGGLFSRVVSAAPGLMGFLRNLWRADGAQPPLPVGQEFHGLSNASVGLILLGQVFLLTWCSFHFTAPAFHTALDRFLYTQEHIQTMWHGFEDACKPSSPDLT